ncbi:Arc family DNA-binding protein [Prauserella cavernicola]|uniref:Arc family DNA-binding protein n=1 Tax=Prauserella cavernicola TaxID=2800127 RepID=A0A934V394_9PSEU|nr:Arc family DNA-binding protein [Prauserella cavernicola]MBK1783399.1 Arc family DNA-binding protein [Prauserella cavernicola]
MDLRSYVSTVRHELAVAAEAGGPEARALAERLSAPLESAIRLTLLDALSAAADEITRDLAPGSVEVRLRGGDPSFAVTPPPADGPEQRAAAPEPAAAPLPDTDDGAVSRINVRMPEQLKARIEEAAAQQGRSVNAWLVQAATAALREPHSTTDTTARGVRSAQHVTGWVS